MNKYHVRFLVLWSIFTVVIFFPANSVFNDSKIHEDSWDQCYELKESNLYSQCLNEKDIYLSDLDNKNEYILRQLIIIGVLIFMISLLIAMVFSFIIVNTFD